MVSLVDLGASVSGRGGGVMVTVFQSRGGVVRARRGKFGAAALAQGEPADAAVGEFVEDLGRWSVGKSNTSRPGSSPVAWWPVVGEGDDLVGPARLW